MGGESCKLRLEGTGRSYNCHGDSDLLSDDKFSNNNKFKWLWVDLCVRLNSMFPASSPQHFTTTLISPPNLPVALK